VLLRDLTRWTGAENSTVDTKSYSGQPDDVPWVLFLGKVSQNQARLSIADACAKSDIGPRDVQQPVVCTSYSLDPCAATVYGAFPICCCKGASITMKYLRSEPWRCSEALLGSVSGANTHAAVTVACNHRTIFYANAAVLCILLWHTPHCTA
jgi:hypothetical protein